MKHPVKRAKEGEWVHPKLKNYRLICCDCGLAHKMDFVILTSEDGTQQGIAFRAFRDEKATAAERRARERVETRRRSNGRRKH